MPTHCPPLSSSLFFSLFFSTFLESIKFAINRFYLVTDANVLLFVSLLPLYIFEILGVCHLLSLPCDGCQRPCLLLSSSSTFSISVGAHLIPSNERLSEVVDRLPPDNPDIPFAPKGQRSIMARNVDRSFFPKC